MIDTERPHRTTRNNSSSSSTTSELFICFTSRLSSSSSMKISSKSILSPGRSRETSQISLSSSLSRRLRSNGSMKGGQASPAMFPTNSNNKKRGCGFENPEPSSPKVTCIGQVRVKTKKQGKKIRARSKRRSGGGEVSFRKLDQNNTQNNNVETNLSEDSNLGTNQFLHHHHQQQQECLPQRNQRWVHLPITICEALRTFGAEFNCFLPCRSSCMANNQRDNNSNKEEKTSNSNGGNGSGSSCGAVFARWLVAVQEGEGEGKGREIELVVGEEEEEDKQRRRSQRRHIFDDIEIDEIEIKNNSNNTKCEDNKEEAEARVSICIPPKNALLLMRCRSDPVKMAALANRFWESPMPQNEEEEEEEEKKEHEQRDTEEIEDGQRGFEHEMDYKEKTEVCEKWVSSDAIEEQEISVPEAETSIDLQREEGEEEEEEEEEEQKQETSPDISEAQETTTASNQEDGGIENEVEAEVKHTESVEEETMLSLEDPGEIVAKFIEESDNELENEVAEAEAEIEAEQENDIDDENENKVTSPKQDSEEDLAEVAAEEKGTREEEREEEEETVTHERSEPGSRDTLEPDPDPGSKASESQQELESETTQNPVLPDCLLLMMCEPKLSMEVSKETWVCSTDFVRWLPERPPVNKTVGVDEPKKIISTDSNKPAQNSTDTQPAANQVLLQPPRSSCSYPAAPPSMVASHGGSSISTVIEQKLVGAKAYEPFVLTRCKSEPMRSAAKLAPDACFWKNRKLEPHRPGTLGVGAAGVGF